MIQEVETKVWPLTYKLSGAGETYHVSFLLRILKEHVHTDFSGGNYYDIWNQYPDLGPYYL